MERRARRTRHCWPTGPEELQQLLYGDAEDRLPSTPINPSAFPSAIRLPWTVPAARPEPLTRAGGARIYGQGAQAPDRSRARTAQGDPAGRCIPRTTNREAAPAARGMA